ncbi:MAG: DUF3343 domain-containing protein [Oscillospiraceae bacterium]|nr:DUF3343 domain-containing protein [Oscillospiraceae bacterium]
MEQLCGEESVQVAHYLIMCRSLTYAQKTARALEKRGITAAIVRPPRKLSQEGCSYCVKVSERRFHQAMGVLHEFNLGQGRIYRLYPDGETVEVAV